MVGFATYRIARQTGGYGLFAKVSVEIRAGDGRISIEPTYLGKHGVVAAQIGAQAGLAALGGSIDIQVTEIVGLHTDTTNPAAAAATYCAIRSAAGRPVPDPQRAADWCRALNIDAFQEFPTVEQLLALHP